MSIKSEVLIMIIIIICHGYDVNCPGYDVKLHPVVEFRRGIMRLPFAATTSRSPLSKVYYLLAPPEAMKFQVCIRRGIAGFMGRRDASALVGNPPSDGVTRKTLVVVQPKIH